MHESSGVITILETDENDDLVLPFPDEILDVLGWQAGDTLSIEVFAGRIIFRKLEQDELRGAQIPVSLDGTFS